jgi:hypothetical protein
VAFLLCRKRARKSALDLATGCALGSIVGVAVASAGVDSRGLGVFKVAEVGLDLR